MDAVTAGQSFQWENCWLTTKQHCVQAVGFQLASPPFPHADASVSTLHDSQK